MTESQEPMAVPGPSSSASGASGVMSASTPSSSGASGAEEDALLDFDMELLRDGLDEYPGSVVWWRKTYHFSAVAGKKRPSPPTCFSPKLSSNAKIAQNV